LCLVVAAAAMCLVLAGASDVTAGIEYDKPDPSVYEGYDAVVLHKYRKHEINMGYSGFETKIKDERVIMVLTPEGIEDFGSYKTPYFHKDYDYKVEACVMQPDGKKVKIKGEHVHETKIGERWRRKTLVFPGLVAGSVIEIVTEQKESDTFSINGAYEFGENLPVVKATLEYRIPQKCTAFFAFTPRTAGRSKPPMKPKGDHNVYLVEKRDLPPYPEEPFMSAKYVNTPKALYMIEQRPRGYYIDDEGRIIPSEEMENITWTMLGDWWRTAYYQWMLGDEDETEKYWADVRKYVDQLSMPFDFEGDMDKINWILERFRDDFEVVEDAVGVDLPADCLKDRKGSEFGVTYVLRSVLESQGIETTPVFVVDRTDGEMDKRVVDSDQFSDVVLMIRESADKAHWIVPDHPVAKVDDLPWYLQGVTGFALYNDRKPNFVTTPVYNPTTNQFHKTYDAVLTEDGTLEGTASLQLSGAYWLRAAEFGDDKEALHEWLRDNDRIGEGMEFETADVECKVVWDTVTVLCHFKRPGFAKETGGVWVIDTAALLRAGAYGSWFDVEDRTHDIEFDVPKILLTEFKLQIPEGLKFESELPDVSVENAYAAYTRTGQYTENGISLVRALRINKPSIPQKAYTELRAFFKQVDESDAARVVMAGAQ
jgi:hypothetical protein